MQLKKFTQKDRYGNTMSYEFEAPEKPLDPTRLMEKQMELNKPDLEIAMMSIPPVGGEEFVMGDPNMHPGEPKGQDTVPAWLTPGEFVVNAEAMSIPENAAMVESINEQGKMMKQGGYLNEGGKAEDKRSWWEKAWGKNNYKPYGERYKNEGGVIDLGILDDADDFGEWRPHPGKAQAQPAPVPMAAPVPPPWSQKPAGLDDLLHEREGFREEVYLDSLGKPTVGYGHLLPEEYKAQVGETPFSQDQLTAWFDEDVRKAQEGAVENLGRETFSKLNPEQQRAVTSMAFQLGKGGQAKFKKMIQAIKDGDHREAAKQALTGSSGGKSKWLKQTPKRAMDLAMAFDPEIAAQYKNAGGVIYASDGGWGSWLKNAANKYVLGEKNQIPDTAPPEVNYGTEDQARIAAALEAGVSPEEIQNSIVQPRRGPGPIAYPEEGLEAWYEKMGRNNDPVLMPLPNETGAPMPTGHDSFTIPTEPEVAGEGNWITDNLLGPAGREAIGAETQDELNAQHDDLLAEMFTEDADMIDEEGDNKAMAAEQSAEYQAYAERAANSGIQPESPQEWLKRNTKNKDGQSPADRAAPMSETAGQSATAKVINEGGTAEQADAAAAAADEVIANGGTQEEAEKAGEKAANQAANPVTQSEGDEPQVDSMTSEGELSIQKVLQEADDAKRKAAQNEAKSLFSELGLDSLFDKKELARMAVMYAGSRLLGYDHGGSLRWSAKNYLNRVDQKEAAFGQLALSGKYTPESLKAFKQSGNYADLLPVGASPELTGEFKTFFGPNGKQQRAQKVKIGNNTVWQTSDGRMVDSSWSDDASMVKGTKEYGQRVKADSTQYTDMIKDLRSQFGTHRDNKGNVSYSTELAPNVAGNKIAKWALDEGVPPQYMGSIIENAYHSALEHSQRTGEKVRDLTPFLEEQYVVAQVGDSSLFQGISGTNVSKLISSVQAVGGQNLNSTQIIQGYRQAWNNLSEDQRKQWDAMATDEENGFMKFVMDDVSKTAAK